MMRKLGVVMVLLAVFVGVLAPAALGKKPAGTTKVTKEAPIVQTKTIDPDNPPPELKPDEAGVAVCDFSCEAQFDLAIECIEEPPPAKVVVTIKGVDMTIDLIVTIWLPDGASQKLIDHENGHCDICKKVYQNAQKGAKAAAQGMIGKTFTAPVPSCRPEDVAAGAQAAADQATAALCEAYKPSSQGVAQGVSDEYDDITDRGTNDEDSKKAVKKAFKNYEKKQKKPKKPK